MGGFYIFLLIGELYYNIADGLPITTPCDDVN
jgi:hypothetical protein